MTSFNFNYFIKRLHLQQQLHFVLGINMNLEDVLGVAQHSVNNRVTGTQKYLWGREERSREHQVYFTPHLLLEEICYGDFVSLCMSRSKHYVYRLCVTLLKLFSLCCNIVKVRYPEGCFFYPAEQKSQADVHITVTVVKLTTNSYVQCAGLGLVLELGQCQRLGNCCEYGKYAAYIYEI